MKTYLQEDSREVKLFWSQIWERGHYSWKAEWINKMGKELQQLEEGPKAKINIDSKSIKWDKCQAMMTYMIHAYWFKRFTSNHNKLTIKMN